MTPKERVRIGVYKALLEEEKNKNKRKSYLTMSVFVVGLFAGSFSNFLTITKPQENRLEFLSTTNENKSYKDNILDSYFNVENQEQEKLEIKTDEYFVFNLQS